MLGEENRVLRTRLVEVEASRDAALGNLMRAKQQQGTSERSRSPGAPGNIPAREGQIDALNNKRASASALGTAGADNSELLSESDRSDLARLKQRLHTARFTLSGALQSLNGDDAAYPPRLARLSLSADADPEGWEAETRWEAEARCLLASLRHADRELRTARNSMASGADADRRDVLGRTPNREDIETQLVTAKLHAAQLQGQQDEASLAIRRLRLELAATRAAGGGARPAGAVVE